jgi:TolB-like protein
MKYSKLINLLIVSSVVASCATPDFHAEHYSSRFKQYGYGFIPEDAEFKHDQSQAVDAKIIKKYTDRIAFEIARQVDATSVPGLVVASFVDLDDNLQNTNPLGNRLAEDLSVSLKEMGFVITDINAEESLKATREGSFIFNRVTDDEIDVPYVLSGIISYTPNGVNINTKLIAVATSTIIAAHTLAMPGFIVEHAFPVVEGQDILIKDQ